MKKYLALLLFAIAGIAHGQGVTQPSPIPVSTAPTNCYGFYALTTASPWTIYAPTTGNGCQTLAGGSGGSGISGLTAGQVAIAGSATTITSSIPISGGTTVVTTSGTTPAGDVPIYNADGSIHDSAIAGSNIDLLNAAQTITAGKTFSFPGVASTPSVEISGTPFAGTNANSFGSLDISWGTVPATTTLNTAGTALTIQEPTASTADLINILHGGTSEFKITSAGAATFANSVTSTNFNSSATQSTVSCSTSGTAVFSQPQKGNSYKLIVIHLAACLGTASYTYPTAFTNIPSVYASNNVAATIATTVSATAVTVTGATSTGSLQLVDY